MSEHELSKDNWLPITEKDWVSLLMSHDFDYIEERYERASVEEIDDWILSKFHELINNKIIYVSSFKIGHNAELFLTDLNKYLKRCPGYCMENLKPGLFPRLTLRIHYGYPISGCRSRSYPDFQRSNDWFIEMSDIVSYAFRHKTDAIGYLKTVVIPVLQRLGDQYEYSLSTEKVANHQLMRTIMLETMTINYDKAK